MSEKKWQGLTKEQVKEELSDIEILKSRNFDYIDGGNSAGYIVLKLNEKDAYIKTLEQKLREADKVIGFYGNGNEMSEKVSDEDSIFFINTDEDLEILPSLSKIVPHFGKRARQWQQDNKDLINKLGDK